MASSILWLLFCSRSWSKSHQSSGNRAGSHDGSCCGRTRSHTRVTTQHPPGWSPTCVLFSIILGCLKHVCLPWRNTASRRLASEVSQHAVRLVKYVSLLLDSHVSRVLMAVPMQSNLMTSIAYCCHVFRECLQAMAWNEPRCLNVVLF